MASRGLRHLYLLSVLDALTAYASEGGTVRFATFNHEGQLAITFTLDDADAYNRRMSAVVNERFEAERAPMPPAEALP